MIDDLPRVCLTGNEPSTAELASRLGRPADFHEVRLDCLEDLSDATFDLIHLNKDKAIVSCRPPWAGGRFEGAEADRIAMLRKAFVTGARYVDLELPSVHQGACGEVTGSACHERILVSVHDFEGTSRLGRHVRDLRGTPWKAAKLAVAVSSARDLVSLRRVGLMLSRQGDIVMVGMGEAGLWTRIRPSDFNSAWTYLAASEDRATAPGQVTWDEALALRLADSPRLLSTALIGGPQVVRSPGPAIYNRVFAQEHKVFQYLPLVATTADEAMEACHVFDVRFASVTHPLKTAVGSLCKVRQDPDFESINMVVMYPDQPRRRLGLNTDKFAFGFLFDELGVGSGTRLLVLGDGATGSLAARIARSRSASVFVASRSNRGKATGVPIPWEDRHSVACDGIVNCTPIGSDGISCPWDPNAPIGASWVMDLALHRGSPTPFVVRASREGRRVVTGFGFWCHQGAKQLLEMGLLTTPEQLRTLGAKLGWS